MGHSTDRHSPAAPINIDLKPELTGQESVVPRPSFKAKASELINLP